MKYPAPMRTRWAVAVEFPDGDRIEGISDDDLVARWARRASWGNPDAPVPTNREFRRTVARRVTRLEETERAVAIDRGMEPAPARPVLPWDVGDAEFLNEGSARGWWCVIRK